MALNRLRSLASYGGLLTFLADNERRSSAATATARTILTSRLLFSLRFIHLSLIPIGAGRMPHGQQSASSATVGGALWMQRAELRYRSVRGGNATLAWRLTVADNRHSSDRRTSRTYDFGPERRRSDRRGNLADIADDALLSAFEQSGAEGVRAEALLAEILSRNLAP